MRFLLSMSGCNLEPEWFITAGTHAKRLVGAIITLLMILASSMSCSQSSKTTENWNKAQGEIEAAKEEARRFFAALSSSGPEARRVWRMSDIKVFGRGDVFEIAAGGPRVAVVLNTPDREEISETEYWINRRDPESFRVTIPFWCSGNSDDGQAVKLRREFDLRIRMNDQSQWEPLSYEFRNDRPLTFLRQVLTWLGWSFIGVPIVLIAFLSNWLSFRFVRALAGIIVLAAVGYIAHVCFGSALAVIIGIVVYVVLLTLIVATFNAIRSSAT